MNYKITNVGCDDTTEGIFDFTQEQFDFLDNVFTELNKNSSYQCMPKIYIEEVVVHPTEKGGDTDA